MSSRLALALHLPLPSRLDSLTLGLVKCFTFGMYCKLKQRLQTYIIKYILSRKLNKKISSIMKRIRTAQYLTDFEITAYTFAHEAPPREELLIKCIKYEKVNFNELVLVNSYLKFNEKFLELYNDYYYNGRLPSHSNHKNKGYNGNKLLQCRYSKCYNIYIQGIYSIPLITNIEPITLVSPITFVSPKKKKEKKNFPPQKKVWYNQRR
jgi:hypothetical protein